MTEFPYDGNKVEDYVEMIQKKLQEEEYSRHQELVLILARNLMLENVIWEDIQASINNAEKRSVLLKERAQIVSAIHAEYKILKIEVSDDADKQTSGFLTQLEGITKNDGRREPTTKSGSTETVSS